MMYVGCYLLVNISPISVGEIFNNQDKYGDPIFNLVSVSRKEGDIEWTTLIYGYGTHYNVDNRRQRSVTYRSNYICPVNSVAVLDLPVNDFTRDSWPHLLSKLEANSIIYSKGFGVLLKAEDEEDEIE